MKDLRRRGRTTLSEVRVQHLTRVGTEPLTSIVVKVGQSVLIGQQDILILRDNLAAQVLPAR